jgi:hypothetical protein
MHLSLVDILNMRYLSLLELMATINHNDDIDPLKEATVKNSITIERILRSVGTMDKIML